MYWEMALPLKKIKYKVSEATVSQTELKDV